MSEEHNTRLPERVKHSFENYCPGADKPEVKKKEAEPKEPKEPKAKKE